ncbi:hypothetical protein F5Y18DRAFT_317273 [Xylariaceae sp. FL1019]|nr:hypothetical protein F5Y18DRAFT_317273 [Xylariaceae sp. FL1019]
MGKLWRSTNVGLLWLLDFGTSVPPEVQSQAKDTTASKTQLKPSSKSGSAAKATGSRASRKPAENKPERANTAVASTKPSDTMRPVSAPRNGTQVTELTTTPPAIVVQNLLDSIQLTKRRLGARSNSEIPAATSSNAQDVRPSSTSARGPLDVSSQRSRNSRSAQASNPRTGTVEVPVQRQSVPRSRERRSVEPVEQVYRDLRQVPDDVLRAWSSGHEDCVWENYLRGREEAREEARRAEAWRATEEHPSGGCPCATCQMMQLMMPHESRRSDAWEYY